MNETSASWMTKRLWHIATALFLVGFCIAFRFATEIYRFLAPERWNEILLTALIDTFRLSLHCGVATGSLFASAPIAVLLSGRTEAWRASVVAYLVGGGFVCFAVARIFPGSHMLLASSPVVAFPLFGAVPAVLLATVLRIAHHFRHHDEFPTGNIA